MSAARRKHRRSDAGEPSPDATTPVATAAAQPAAAQAAAITPVPPGSLQRSLLILAVLLAAAWGIGLVVLCLLTANPPLVSRDQFAQSEFVVTIRLPVDADGRLEVRRVWSGDLKSDKIRVDNLHEAQAIADPKQTEFVLPLSRFGRSYRITMLEKQSAPPLMYPATPAIEDQVKQVLRDERR